MRRHRFPAGLLLALVCLFSLMPRPAQAQDLVADLSDHLIAITTGFTGAEVVLFGAVDEPGDVVVVVQGPAENVALRRKQRIAGIWVNRTVAQFERIPSFYHAASSRSLDEIAPPSVLDRHDLGVNYLDLVPVDSDDLDDEELENYRQAVIRQKQSQGTYGIAPGAISFIGDRLFRTSLVFPESVPTGNYLVSVYYLRDGNVVSAQTTPLSVSKVGIGAEIFLFAHEQPAFYGLLAIIVAVLSGWLASLPFRTA